MTTLAIHEIESNKLYVTCGQKFTSCTDALTYLRLYFQNKYSILFVPESLLDENIRNYWKKS